MKMPAVKVCPKCGSENVKVDHTNAKAAAGFGAASYLCLDCGFTGSLFPEINKEDSKDAREEK